MKITLCRTAISGSVTNKSKAVEVHRRMTSDCVQGFFFSIPAGFITVFCFQACYNSPSEPASIHKTRLQQLLQQMYFSET